VEKSVTEPDPVLLCVVLPYQGPLSHSLLYMLLGVLMFLFTTYCCIYWPRDRSSPVSIVSAVHLVSHNDGVTSHSMAFARGELQFDAPLLVNIFNLHKVHILNLTVTYRF
jgi:hypothetical protein